MDFSHVVSLPCIEPEGRGPGLINAVKHRLATLDQDHSNQVFDQSNKFRKLHAQQTQQMVYLVLEGGSVPIPEKLSQSHRHARAIGDFSLETFNSMAQDIPVTILSTIPNCEEVYLKTCAKHNLVSNVKKFLPIDRFGIMHVLKFNIKFEQLDDPCIDCNYLFHITNGRTKMQRILMMEELWNRKLLHKALWSWHCDEDESHNVDPATHINPTFNFPYKQHKPLDKMNQGRSIPFEQQTTPDTPKGYDDAYIDVMVESIEEPHAIYITEKTMRPYMYLKPCLQLNNYGHYRYLESLGIELYDELFDYDIIERSSIKERITGIADNISNLAQYDKATMNKKILQCKDKMIHNRQILLNLQMETMPTPELEYLLSHNLVPNDLNTPQRVSTIGTKWINR